LPALRAQTETIYAVFATVGVHVNVAVVLHVCGTVHVVPSYTKNLYW